MRIITIIRNELFNQKIKLENELERLINDKTKPTDCITKESLEVLNKLTSTDQSMETLDKYLNKEEKQN
tara:strand:- start:121 stop:327 length:207 start_codon:yes stop_codon:yes gene_type:complete